MKRVCQRAASDEFTILVPSHVGLCDSFEGRAPIDEIYRDGYLIFNYITGICLSHLSLVPHMCVSESDQHQFR